MHYCLCPLTTPTYTHIPMLGNLGLSELLVTIKAAMHTVCLNDCNPVYSLRLCQLMCGLPKIAHYLLCSSWILTSVFVPVQILTFQYANREISSFQQGLLVCCSLKIYRGRRESVRKLQNKDLSIVAGKVRST